MRVSSSSRSNNSRRRYSESSMTIRSGDENADDVGRTRCSSMALKLSDWFLPNSEIRLSWDVFIFIVISYNSLVTPVRIFIMSGDSTPQALVYADVAFDFIFVIDTLLHFCRPYVDEDTGQAITDLKAIRTRYVGSVTFYINAIACIPILKMPLSPFLSKEAQNLLMTNFNLLRMIRILHLPSQFQELKLYQSQKGPVNESVFRMWIILFFTLLGMCILGCVYFGWSIASASVDDICPPSDDFAEEILSAEMWVANDFVITDVMDPDTCEIPENNDLTCDDCPQSLFFVRSIYFLMQTLFTIGYGDSVVPSKSPTEMALACVFMVTGVFAYGLIIANMTSVLANLDVVSMRFRHEMDTIARWLSFRSAPETLRDRINMCFTFFGRAQHGMLDDALFGELPPGLSKEFAELHVDLLTKIPFFDRQHRNELFLSRIATTLIRRVYPPGSYILYQGEKQRELVIVKSGRADVYIKGSSDAVGSLLPGDFMGDYQLLFGTVNQVGLRSPDFTEALVLTFDNFEKVMDHPDCSGMNFRALGGNFRRSTDQGALDTIEHSKESLKKISMAVSNIASKQKSNKLKDMMEKSEVVVKGFRILPDSRVHVFWDIFALFAIMYYSMSCPVRFASYFRTNSLKSSYDMVFIVDYALDILFIVDMLLRMRVYAYVSYASGRNEIVMDREQMTKNYLRSPWFRIDVLSILPYDLISLATGYYSVFRLPKMVRTVQIPSIISRLQRNFDDCMQITMNETQVSSLNMFLCSVLIVVWSSAGWNALREGESAYFSVYWAFTTLTTVGYGDRTPANFRETCYALFVGAAGATFSAAIIANVTSFFHDVEISEDNIDHKVNCLKCFMERHSSPLEHVKKVNDYFEYIEREQDGLNEDLILNKAVPDNIKDDMLINITQSMVLNCDFFAECESGFIRRMMVSLEQRFFGTQYMIMTSSTPADGMYFVKKGVVELLNESAGGTLKVTKRIEADESFAEGCLLEHWDKNMFLARAATNCELWFLSRSTFNRLVNDFPRVRALLSTFQTKNLTTGRRASVHSVLKAAEKARRKSAVFIHPDSYFIQAWFGLILSVTIYNAITLPLRVAFLENHEISAKWAVFDYTGDAMLLADMIIRGAFLAFYDDNHLIVERGKIWSHYWKSGNLKWHGLSALPLEVVIAFVPTLCPFWTLQVWSLFRLSKLLRLSEIAYLLQRVESSLAKAGVKVPKNQLRVGKLVMVILLSAHLVACIFFVIANINQHRNAGNSNEQNNWANSEGLLDTSPACPGDAVDAQTAIRQYIAAMYWSMATLTTVGYGDITAHENSVAEVVFAIFILVIGTAIYTLVIALLEDIVSQLDVTSSLFKMKMNTIEAYMQSQGLPDGIKTKIVAYYENLWSTQLGVKGGKLLHYLPRSLRCDLTFDMLSPLLEKTFFVKDCTADFVANILRSLTLEMYLPDDTVFHDGERCDALNILYKGQVDLLTSKNIKFKTVSDCLLGESSFFGFEPHICTAKAADLCEVFQLSIKDFLTQLHDNQLLETFAEYLESNKTSLAKSKASIEKMVQNLKSSKMAKMLSVDVLKSIPSRVILPDSAFRQAWDSFALLGVMAFTFTIPYQISFTDTGVSLFQFLFDAILDAFFVADIYARAMRFAVSKDGFLVSQPTDFRRIYFRGDFPADVVSAIPASTVAYILDARMHMYGLMRLLQLTRVRHFRRYLERFVETYELRTSRAVSTAFLRILQMFLGVIVLCHWFACIFHLMADLAGDNDENWLVADETIGESMAARYLRSFYWALYTVSTIGYGSVRIISNAERIFAMFVMAIGAVICDAGITAVLTSIISNRDHQASTNNRRIQCSKRFMQTNFIADDLQERVLDYYAYADFELHNINEADILDDLSSSLRSEVLFHFCFDSLRASHVLRDLSDGAVISLVHSMRPYIAIPGENVSQIGRECSAIYVLQRGLMCSTDTTGMTEQMPPGVLVGHLVTRTKEELEGLPVRGIRIDIVGANSLKTKYGSPYLVFRCGTRICRSSIKKTKDWKETVFMKLANDCKIASIEVKSWRRENMHPLIGCAEVPFDAVSTDVRSATLKDPFGKRAGSINLRITQYDLPKYEVPLSHELTVTAEGYCHLYRMEQYEIARMRQYLTQSKEEIMWDRLPLDFDEEDEHRQISDEDRTRQAWRRPSRPCFTTTPAKERRRSSATSATEIDVGEPDDSDDIETPSQSQESGLSEIPNQKFWSFSDRRKIVPITEEVNGAGEGRDKSEVALRWGGSNTIRTRTIVQRPHCSQEEEPISSTTVKEKASASGNNTSNGDSSEEPRDWDTLVELTGGKLSNSVKEHSSRRASFFIEWESE